MRSRTGLAVHLKQWREEGALFYPSVWILCGLFVVLWGNIHHFTGVEWLNVDLIPVFLVYLIAKEQDLKAFCFAFFMGLLKDILAPCQLGLFAFTYSVLLFGMTRCRQFLNFNNLKTSVLLVAAFLLGKWVFFLVVLRLFPGGQFIPSIHVVEAASSVVMTTLVSPFLFSFLDFIKGGENQNYD